MKADASFQKGYKHLVCQDYAYAYHGDDYTLIMVADGCSSSPHTDVGARLLVHQLMTCFNHQMQLNADTLRQAMLKARAVLQTLSIPPQALDCTLLIALYRQDQDRIHVMATGDGVIAMYQQDGSLTGVEINYPNHMPGYLNYWAEQSRKNEYLQQDQGVTYRRLGTKKVHHHGNGLDSLSLQLNASEIKSMILCSDGISSFPHMTTEEALMQLSVFPSTQGTFVQRRLNKFTRKISKQKDHLHQDDLAIAALHV